MAIHKRFDKMRDVVPGTIMCVGEPKPNWASTRVWGEVTCKRCLIRSEAQYASMREFAAAQEAAEKPAEE